MFSFLPPFLSNNYMLFFFPYQSSNIKLSETSAAQRYKMVFHKTDVNKILWKFGVEEESCMCFYNSEWPIWVEAQRPWVGCKAEKLYQS